MLNDPKLKKNFKELYYLCNNFFENSYEERFIIYIIEEIERIEKHISKHYTFDLSLMDFKNSLPKFEKTEIDQIPISIKEKFFSGLLFIFIFPLFCGRILYTDSSYFDDLKEKLVYRDKKREKKRSQVTDKIVQISSLTIGMLGKIK